MRVCPYCNQPIVLNPSATERAKSTGLPVSYYTNLFTSHSECAVAERSRQSSELMTQITKVQKEKMTQV